MLVKHAAHSFVSADGEINSLYLTGVDFGITHLGPSFAIAEMKNRQNSIDCCPRLILELEST